MGAVILSQAKNLVRYGRRLVNCTPPHPSAIRPARPAPELRSGFAPPPLATMRPRSAWGNILADSRATSLRAAAIVRLGWASVQQ